MQFADQVLKLGLSPFDDGFQCLFDFDKSILVWIAISLPSSRVVWYVAVKTLRFLKKQIRQLDKINFSMFRENLTGLRVIRACQRRFSREEVRLKNAVYADNSNKLFKLTGLTEPLFVKIIIAMIVAIVWFALSH